MVRRDARRTTRVNTLLVAVSSPHLTDALATALHAEQAQLTVRQFPDGETYVRFESSVKGRDVVILADLSHPDDKLISLLWTASTARDLGAARIGLVAPYLPYMRQDARFQPGEGVTSQYFSALVSSHFDWLVTVDPHLHRVHSLDDLYAIPTLVARAAPVLARWISEHVRAPVLIGPDAESEQWVGAVAGVMGAPCLVLAKTRLGDREVRISIPDIDKWRGRTPVLIDDVISTGGTMIETTRALLQAGMEGPVCVAVHGIFVENAQQALLDAGCRRVVTCNTVPHPTNDMDIVALLAEGIREVMSVRRSRPAPRRQG